MRGITPGFFDEAVHVDFFEPRYVPECDGAAEEGENGDPPGGAERSVFVVGRTAVPGAEAGS